MPFIAKENDLQARAAERNGKAEVEHGGAAAPGTQEGARKEQRNKYRLWKK